jgi:peptide/nickel transport system ATP-binding protein
MTSLNPVQTVGSQVGEAVRLHRGLTGAEEREEVVRLFREVGIPEAKQRVDAYPHELSGGLRQRVMIAMALAGNPALLVADEPTTALDVTIQAQILDLLQKIREERGMALLLISHDLRAVARICQRVVVMYGGRAMEVGSTERLLSEPLHPYTRGLLGSRLTIHDRRRSLRPIPGEIPEATAWPSGCRFHPRCTEAVPACGGEEPELLRQDAHLARCFFPWEGGA